jgi:hypothetical protein
MQVNTLIIGSGRCGTTSLHKILESHPQVCFSKIKEVHYFSLEDLHSRGEKYYESFFPHLKNEKVLASADTYLLMDYDAISRIKAYNPNMKLIVMLRNPVDRAYSSYNYSINYGYHQAYNSFLDCIEKEGHIENEKSIIIRNNLGHFYGSLYARHLTEWLRVFPRENILILTIGDLKSNLNAFKTKLSSFLSIEAYTVQEAGGGEKQNPNAIPRFKAFEQFLLNRENPVRKFIQWVFPPILKRLIIHSNLIDKIHDFNRKQSEYEPLDEFTYNEAMKYFKEDLKDLKSEFGIEL